MNGEYSLDLSFPGRLTAFVNEYHFTSSANPPSTPTCLPYQDPLALSCGEALGPKPGRRDCSTAAQNLELYGTDIRMRTYHSFESHASQFA